MMTFFRIVAWLAIGPAIYVNVEASSRAWMPFAIGSVILAAVFVYLAWKKRSFWFGTLAAIFTLINLTTALGNVANITADTVDGRSSVIERKDETKRRRIELNIARKEQVALAGEVAAMTFDGRLQSLIASDATRWTASEHCNPDKITQAATKVFCTDINKVQEQRAAALKRDEIDGKLAEVDKQTVFGGPSAADPYAESLARFLVVFGYQADDRAKELLSSSRDWGRAFGLELMAAFGPTGLTEFFDLLLLSMAMARAVPPSDAVKTEFSPVSQAAAVERPKAKPRTAQKRLPSPLGENVVRLGLDVRGLVKNVIREDGRLYVADAAPILIEKFNLDPDPKKHATPVGLMLRPLGIKKRDQGGTYYKVA